MSSEGYLNGIDVLGTLTPARVQSGADTGKIAKWLYDMKPMSVKQAQGACSFGVTLLGTAVASEKLSSLIPTSNPKRDKLLSDLAGLGQNIERLGQDPLPEDVAEKVRVGVLEAVAEYNGMASTAAVQTDAVKQIPKDMAKNAQTLFEDAKAAAKKVSWYASVTLWVAVGAGVLVLGGMTYAFVKGRT